MKYYAEKFSDKGTIAVDDTILIKDSVSSAGSYMLEGFKSLFSAEAVERSKMFDSSYEPKLFSSICSIFIFESFLNLFVMQPTLFHNLFNLTGTNCRTCIEFSIIDGNQ